MITKLSFLNTFAREQSGFHLGFLFTGRERDAEPTSTTAVSAKNN